MNFREANNRDISKLLELEQCVVEAERPFNSLIKAESVVYYDLEHLIASNDSCLLVVEAEGDIIGTGYVQIRKSKQSRTHEHHAYLGFMYVAPDYRGRGLNAELMERLIDWSKQRGIKDFYLDVYSANRSAIRAYEKLGFEPSLLEMKLSLN